MQLPSPAQICDAQTVVYRHLPPTPQYTWPLANERLSAGERLGVGVGKVLTGGNVDREAYVDVLSGTI